MDPAPPVQFHNTSGTPTPETFALLNEAERTRAARFHFEHDRHRWINGRAWVKHQLATRLHVPAWSLLFSTTDHGRPFLPDHPGTDFNLSHTSEWIALAICQDGRRIGIDLETVDPTFPALEIAAEFFLPEERDWIASGPVGRFFHLWTAKEALMKATGRGMSMPPDKIRVSIHHGSPATVTDLENADTSPVNTWHGPGNTVIAAVLV